MAGSVNQTSGMVIFEDVLMTDVTAVDTWLTCSIYTIPVVNLTPHAKRHLTQLGHFELERLVRGAICQV